MTASRDTRGSRPPPIPDARGPDASGTTAHGVRSVSSSELFGNARALMIEHEGVFYRLQRTSRGKLILTK